MDFITIHTSYPNSKSGKELLNKLTNDIFNHKIPACVTSHLINSSYIWQGKINNDKEIAVIIKSNISFYQEIAKLINLNHCYEVPQIFYQIISGGSKEYLSWLENNQNT